MRVKPSQRQKKRYIAFETLLQGYPSKDAGAEVEIIAKKSLGAHWRDAGIKMMQSRRPLRPGVRILRISNRFAKSFVDHLNKTSHLRTLGMSGILHIAEKKFVKG